MLSKEQKQQVIQQIQQNKNDIKALKEALEKIGTYEKATKLLIECEFSLITAIKEIEVDNGIG